MTRHRRNDPDDRRGRALACRDYESAPRRPSPAAGYGSESWDGPPRGAERPARRALGTSSGRDDGAGEATGPPWERRPRWDDCQAERGGASPGGQTR